MEPEQNTTPSPTPEEPTGQEPTREDKPAYEPYKRARASRPGWAWPLWSFWSSCTPMPLPAAKSYYSEVPTL